MTTLGTLHIMPYYTDLIGKNHINFGESADLILNPTVLAFMHKTNQFNLALFIRVNAAISFLKSSPTHSKDMKNNYDYQVKFYKYCKLSKVIEKIFKNGIVSLSRLSNRYYYAWRITKAHSFIFYVTSQPKIYEEAKFKDLAVKFLTIAIEDIDDLTFLYDTALRQINEEKATLAAEMEKEVKKTNFGDKQGQKFADNSPVTSGNSRSSMSSQNGIGDQGDNIILDPETLTPASVNNGSKSASDSDYTPHSSGSDNDFLDMIHNKEIDQLWMQLLKDDNSSGYFGPQNDTNFSFSFPGDIYHDFMHGTDDFTDI